jgi:hypothetical protein
MVGCMADDIFEHPRLVAIDDALDPRTDLDVYAASLTSCLRHLPLRLRRIRLVLARACRTDSAHLRVGERVLPRQGENEDDRFHDSRHAARPTASGLVCIQANDAPGWLAAKAPQSSVHLAASPDVAGVTGAYYNKNITLVPWPESVLDSPFDVDCGIPSNAGPASSGPASRRQPMTARSEAAPDSSGGDAGRASRDRSAYASQVRRRVGR